VRRHGGAGRAVLDDPEQLPVGDSVHLRAAGEVARRRGAGEIRITLPVAVFTVTKFARQRFCGLLVEGLSFFQIFGSRLQGIRAVV